MIDPSLWSSIPPRNPSAWADFLGQFEIWHRALAQTIARTTGRSIYTFPMGDGGSSEWLSAVQRVYAEATAALGIAGPTDLQSYDLNNPTEFASWAWLVSLESRRVRLAAGLP